MSSPWSPAQVLLRTKLREMRDGASLTQVQLAERLGKPQSYVSKAESGDRSLNLLEVRAYCMACGRSFVEFVSELDAVL